MTTYNNQNIFEAKRREIYWQLKEIGLEEQECQVEARLIIEHVSGIKQAQQIIKNIDEFPQQWQQEITRIINLRRDRRPLAYCLGEIEFAGLMYKVIPGVLIPRTDTETLIEAVVEWVESRKKNSLSRTEGSGGEVGEALEGMEEREGGEKNRKKIKAQDEQEEALNLNIAEIGVGSGIIAISLLKRLPQCRVWACDISEAAITITLGNARRHGVHERLTLVQGDWRKVLPNDFDVIVSNPPYVSSLLNPRHNLKQKQTLAPLAPKDKFVLPKHKVAPEGAVENTKKSEIKELEIKQLAIKQLAPEIYFEPEEALYAGEDGLDFYRDFARLLPEHFKQAQKGEKAREAKENKDNGAMSLLGAFEIGDGQEEAAMAIFKKNGWQNLEIRKDVNGLPRVVLTRDYIFQRP